MTGGLRRRTTLPSRADCSRATIVATLPRLSARLTRGARPVTVAIEEGGVPKAYGVVANISEAGACVWTDAGLDPGRAVNLRLSFAGGPQPLDAEGVVAWANAAAGTRLYGLRWTDQSEARRARVNGIIASSARVPGTSPRSAR